MRRTLLALLCALSLAPWARAQEIKFGLGASGGGTTTIVSGVTPITGGADTQLCFNDGGFAACGDAGLIYAKATDILTMLGGATIGSVTTAGRATLNLRDTITGSSATSNFLNITGAFPATLSAATSAIYSTVAFDDSNQQQAVIRAVATGLGPAAQISAAVWGDNASTASQGGVGGYFTANTTSPTNIGVWGQGSAGTRNVGGFFTLGVQSLPGSSAALIADNVAVAANIFEARDNGTAVLTVADGGATTAAAQWLWNASSYFAAQSGLYFGAAPNSGVAGVVYRTEFTPDSVVLSTPVTSNSWHVAELADVLAVDMANGACGTSACTDPGLIIHSAVQDTTQYNHLSNWGQAGGALKTLTESAATSVVRIPVAALEGTGGKLTYRVKAADATDVQIREGEIRFAIVNKAGTETCTLSGASEAADGSVVAASVGTLTYGITCDTTPANAVDIQFNAVSSLTQTTLNIQYFVTLTGVGQPARQ